MCKKYLSIILFLFVLVVNSSAFQSYEGDTWEKIKTTGSGEIVLTYVETPAFSYKDKNDKLQGICVDIMNSFINYVQHNYKVKITTKYVGDGANFKKFYDSVKNSKGGVFGLGNVTIRDDRKKEVSFTPSYIKSIALLVTHSDAPELKDVTEMKTKFAGYKAYVPKGTTHEQRMLDLKRMYFPDLIIEYAPTSFEALERTVSDKKAICFQDIALYWDFKQKGSPIKYINFETTKGEELGMIMPLNSDWAPLFEEFFSVGAGFKSSSVYRTSLMKHLGTEVVQMLKMAQ